MVEENEKTTINKSTYTLLALFILEPPYFLRLMCVVLIITMYEGNRGSDEECQRRREDFLFFLRECFSPKYQGLSLVM